MRDRIWAALLTAAAFAAALWMYTRHNEFPYGYHSDELSKINQIVSPDGFRNFLHPQLMLECVQRAVDWTGSPDVKKDKQAVVVIGRRVSAIFAATAVAAVCILGYLYGGFWGLALLGLSILFCSPLVIYSHYLKEDASLAFGVCVTLLASRCVIDAKSRSGQWAAILFLGLGCALAASAKYVGVSFTVAGIATAIFAPATHWRQRILRPIVLLISAAAFASLVNYRAVLHFSKFRIGLDDEYEHGLTGHIGLTMNHPNTFFIRTLPIEMGWPMLSLGILAIFVLLFSWRRRSAWDVMMILIGPVFLLIISFGVLAGQRYLLPVVLLMHITAALGALWIMQEMQSRGQRIAIAGIFAGLFLLIGLPRCIATIHEFGDDSRDRLRAWVIANLPPGSFILADYYTGLIPTANFHQLPVHAILGKGIYLRLIRGGPDFGIDWIRAMRRPYYVAISDGQYERYFTPELHDMPTDADWVDRDREWYRHLLNDCQPIWKSDPDFPLHAFTNPAIRLYRFDAGKE
jgi:hypothetical protein